MPQGRDHIGDHHPHGDHPALRLEALFERLGATGPVKPGGLADHLQRVAATAAATLHVDGSALMLCSSEDRPSAIAASSEAAALHGALSAPIQLGNRPVGNLSVFSRTPHDWP